MSIKRTVHVNERPYELTVENEKEEIILNEAVAMLNNKIKEISQQVTGRDRNDLLAMAALEIAAHHVTIKQETSFLENDMAERLKVMDKLLEENIQKP